MTSYLIGRGYKKIGYIGGETAHNDRTQDRLQGHKDALKKNGRKFDPSLTRESQFEFKCGAIAMKSLLTKHHDIDCVFAASDIIAFGALMECRSNDIKIPDDIALAGFDDALIGAFSTPALTTISVPRERIGFKAAEIVLRLRAGGTDIKKYNDLGFEIKIRETT
ncbi:MAG: substrate-binding domain-containing protein [Rhodospirillales bacterium]|nr:substrate-binding domain-containing protein [Rhodospirillales bacterium]